MRMKTNQARLTIDIDRSVFQKSHEERVALKDMKRQVKEKMQQEHGDNWRNRFNNPKKL